MYSEDTTSKIRSLVNERRHDARRKQHTHSLRIHYDNLIVELNSSYLGRNRERGFFRDTY